MKKVNKCRILDNYKISDSIYEMVLESNMVAEPGQFFMLRAWQEYPLLSRPFSVGDSNGKEIRFLYQVVGRGTKIMAKKKKGDFVEILGPLGRGFPLFPEKNCALVAGGIGLAPMKYLARNLNKVDLYAGFSVDPYYIDEMAEIVDNIFIATDDGREGHKGYVTDILKDEYDVVYACGPTPMLKVLLKQKLKAQVYVSLEEHMGCGFGACYGCAIKTTQGTQRICHDGPVFDGRTVIFDA